MSGPRNSPPPWEPAIPIWDWPGFDDERRAEIRDWYEERAAIFEYLGDFDRAEAERRAYLVTVDRYGEP